MIREQMMSGVSSNIHTFCWVVRTDPDLSTFTVIQVEQQLPGQGKSGDKEDGEPAVSLSHRALPLIELLEAAAKKKCNVMWDK